METKQVSCLIEVTGIAHILSYKCLSALLDQDFRAWDGKEIEKVINKV